MGGDPKCNVRNNGLNKPETAVLEVQQDPSLLHFENPEKPLEQANVADVADRNPEKGADA